MANPDEEGSFHIPGEKSPAVKVGEELTIGLTPSSEIEVRIAEMERKLGIPRDPKRFPRTTLALPNEGVEGSLEIEQGTSPTPRQFIQGLIDGLPQLKLPPLPPLPPLPVFPASKPNPLLRERPPSPPEEKGKVAVVSEEPKPQAEIIPLVYE